MAGNLSRYPTRVEIDVMEFQPNGLPEMAVDRSLPYPNTRPCDSYILVPSLNQRSCLKSRSVTPPVNVWKRALYVSGDTIYFKIQNANLLHSLALWWNGRTQIRSSQNWTERATWSALRLGFTNCMYRARLWFALTTNNTFLFDSERMMVFNCLGKSGAVWDILSKR